MWDPAVKNSLRRKGPRQSRKRGAILVGNSFLGGRASSRGGGSYSNRRVRCSSSVTLAGSPAASLHHACHRRATRAKWTCAAASGVRHRRCGRQPMGRREHSSRMTRGRKRGGAHGAGQLHELWVLRLLYAVCGLTNFFRVWIGVRSRRLLSGTRADRSAGYHILRQRTSGSPGGHCSHRTWT